MLADPFPIPRPDAGGAGDGRTAPKDHGTVGRIEGSAGVGETVFLTENLIATAGKQREHHPDIAPTDYARLQRLLDEGEVFRDRYSPRAATAFLEEDSRLWRAAVKATGDGLGDLLWRPSTRRSRTISRGRGSAGGSTGRRGNEWRRAGRNPRARPKA